jgi:hypothetical protein
MTDSRRPGRRFPICLHKDSALITRALTAGESMQDIASRFSVGRQTRPYTYRQRRRQPARAVELNREKLRRGVVTLHR